MASVAAAAQLGATDALRSYVADGHDVDAVIHPVSVKWSALQYAAAVGNLIAAKALLDAGAAANKRTEEGQTSLHLAARFGHANTVELLLAAGADVEASDKLGYTPLHYAAAFGNLEATRAIVQYGADVQAVSAEGSSALDLASEGRQAAVAQFLAAAGSTRSATARLKDWLHAIRLGGYFNAFLAQGFDDVDFIATSGLTQADLDAVGVTLAGHRSKLLQVYRISEFTSGSAAAGAGEGSDSDDGSDSDSDSGSGSDSGSDTDESE